MKLNSRLNPRLATAVVCSSLLSSFLVVGASADTYHSVEPGETLGAVAKRYDVSPDALRAANKLTLGDNSQLAAMLLRIPGVNDAAETKLPSLGASTSKSSGIPSSAARYFGSVTKYISYTTQPGDTLESIAAKFSGGAQEVSAAEIRSKNNLTAAPAAGSTLQIPVKTNYSPPPSAALSRSASAQVAPTTSTPLATTRAISADKSDRAGSSDAADMNVSVSEEMELPFARTVPSSGTPVYQAPNATRVDAKPEAQPRGTNTLTSRGGFPSPTINRRSVDGGRILQNGEEIVTTPKPRVQSPQAETSKLARVAKVAHYGARIRRLPDAGAVTLYRCATGTELAVLKQSGMWSAILMSDRSTGWMPTRYIKFSGTSVDVSTQVVTDDNRSDAESDWKSGYNSNHPAVRNALTYMGTRYVYGGESRSGIDCSSLVQHAFSSCGVKLPRTAATQARVGKAVAPENLQPGDRLYFSASGTRIDHTGLYMGNGLFVHASGRARQVTVSRLSDRRNWNIFVCARR